MEIGFESKTGGAAAVADPTTNQAAKNIRSDDCFMVSASLQNGSVVNGLVCSRWLAYVSNCGLSVGDQPTRKRTIVTVCNGSKTVL